MPNAIVDVITNTIQVNVHHARTATNTKRVNFVAFTITLSNRYDVATAIKDSSGPIAYATFVIFTYTIVHVIANAVSIHIGHAHAAAHPKCIKLISLTVAIPFRDVRTSAIKHFARSVANATDVAVQTGPVVGVCLWVKVARALIDATEGHRFASAVIKQHIGIKIERGFVGATAGLDHSILCELSFTVEGHRNSDISPPFAH